MGLPWGGSAVPGATRPRCLRDDGSRMGDLRPERGGGEARAVIRSRPRKGTGMAGELVAQAESLEVL